MSEPTAPTTPTERFLAAIRSLGRSAVQGAATSAQMALLSPPPGLTEDWYR
jgi:hypothetical protein